MLKIQVSKLYTIASFSSYNDDPYLNIFSTLMLTRGKIHNTRKQNQLDEIFLQIFCRFAYLFSEFQSLVGKTTLSGSLNLLSQLSAECPSTERTNWLADDSPNPAALLAELTVLAWRTPSAIGPNSDRFNEQPSVILIIHTT